MKISSSIEGVCERNRPVQGIKDIKNAGFKNVLLDLNMFYEIEIICPGKDKIRKDIVTDMKVLADGVDKMISTSKDEGLGISIARLPYLKSKTRRKDLDDKVIELSIEGISVAEKAGCKYIIAQPIFAGIERCDEWEENKKYYLKLADACSNSDTMILLVNQCRNVSGHFIRGICSDAEEANEWIESLNEEVGFERFGFCLDAGVCNICGQDKNELIKTLGDNLKAVILRDNDGVKDKALLPFTYNGGGPNSEWIDLIRGLRDACFDGEFVFEYGDTATGISPLIKPIFLTFAKEVSDFFEWQIGLENSMKKYKNIVLFGAGNMCRNYMKNYGDKYRPLFTCDNSSARWGEEFCGLEIKSPEELKNLPDDSVVFICNVYYREIEAQLREMGIKNIEYFNDEYMPSFHMDRLARR